MTFYLKLSIMS